MRFNIFDYCLALIIEMKVVLWFGADGQHSATGENKKEARWQCGADRQHSAAEENIGGNMASKGGMVTSNIMSLSDVKTTCGRREATRCQRLT